MWMFPGKWEGSLSYMLNPSRLPGFPPKPHTLSSKTDNHDEAKSSILYRTLSHVIPFHLFIEYLVT